MTFKIMLKNVKPFEASIDPALLFDFEITHDKWAFSTLVVEGSLFSEDKKFLAKLREAGDSGNNETLGELAARGSVRDSEFKERFNRHSVPMLATFSKKALDYIEETRDKNSKHNVVFNLQLRIKSAYSHVRLANVKPVVPQSFGLPKKVGQGKILTYENRDDWSTSYQNLWVLSADSGPVFLTIQDVKQAIRHEIPSSEWVYDFAPALELGKFWVIEIPQIVPLTAKDKLGRRINAAIKAIQVMETKIRAGEWNEAVKEARPFMELVREKKSIGDLLIKNGYTQDAADAFYEGITELFNFSSKFIHKVAKGGGKLLPEIKAEKEDAYLIYSLSASLLNLIARKKVKTK